MFLYLPKLLYFLYLMYFETALNLVPLLKELFHHHLLILKTRKKTNPNES